MTDFVAPPCLSQGACFGRQGFLEVIARHAEFTNSFCDEIASEWMHWSLKVESATVKEIQKDVR
ncbi:MAG: hypothetical protein OXI60_10455 [Acidiferrobacterales bacterium]|nr:hypothetical protein [Acidiferrobacterales bacterium]